MASNEKTLRDNVLPNLEMVQESITSPAITANNVEIKPAMIQNNLQSKGTMTEDPNQHLKHGVIDDGIRLRLFPFSLINNSFFWLNSQAPGSIMTRDELAGNFFLFSKMVQLRREFTTFKQLEGESFHETWEYFKTLIQRGPHH
ncbi:reverse transcriptase [Gossypium australe]|uniref:Reverse transcriptase n=1 Tax=Gossypium australe TaxID=47621 RepID=A0A5B6WTV2_9ROSI|nr:reverse transcriptase [Gossypium australe]